MKFLFSLFMALSAFSATAADFNLTVSFSFKGIEEGYDHKNKIIVYIDGEKAGESSVKFESEPNSVRVPISGGPHTVKIENWALYQGDWELHSKENEYSFDLINTEDINVRKNTKITLVYDLDNGTTIKIK